MTATKTLSIAIIGPGLVGSALIQQLHRNAVVNGAVHLSVVAIANSKKVVTASGPSGKIDLSAWQQQLNGSSTSANNITEQIIQYLGSLSNPVVIDCTSSESVAASYPAFLKNKIHMITPNKKAFSSNIQLYQDIQSLSYPSLSAGPFIYHESTVGAGLPVLSTLNDLIQTGDKVLKIEGVVSGTLAYIFGNFSPVSGTPKKFSECVRVAKELGYTEPDPRDDLNGLDVARKCLILSRLCGMKLTLENLEIKNLIPSKLRDVALDEFLTRLDDLDIDMGKLNAEAVLSKEVVRYVGVVDLENQKVNVELKRYSHSHPFANLKGSDNMIAFTTQRFPNPLIIQGAGAGADVTAFGIFSDLLKISRSI